MMKKKLTKDSLGIFPVYKPKGMTSHDVIYRVRRITGVKRVGHAGTLDPLASGVLIVAVGREYTKTLDSLMKTDKEYVAELMLGLTSTTDDDEGEKTVKEGYSRPNKVDIEKVLSNWVGEVSQVPPIYSAIKVKGKPAHRRVRSGQNVELSPRLVVIKSIEFLSYEWPILRIKVTCEKGVYIRSIARDIGEALGTGAYLSSLERTRVGEFTIEDCDRIDSDDEDKFHA
jgi:tRNA pseudouridine55 synthase